MVFFILIAGIFCYFSLPKQEYPVIDIPIAIVTTIYPGASVQDIEELITKKVEDLAMSAEYFDRVTSQSYNGASVVIVQFDAAADTDSIDKSITTLRYKLEALRAAALPEGAIVQFNTDISETTGLMLAITGETQSMAELAERGETLKTRLRSLEGIKNVEIGGDLQERIEVTVDMARLNKTTVSLTEIGALIQYQNSMIPAGNIEFDDDVITVQTSGIFTSLKDIEDIIIGISPQTGAITRLKDIADIAKNVDMDAKRYQYNGKAAILISLSFREKINIVSAGKEVQKTVDEYIAELPTGLSIDTVVDIGADVGHSVSDFTISILQAFIIVLIIVMLGMNLRNGSIIAFAIPISIMVPFLVMTLLGIDIQFISLAALIMALGMLVDNAVVVSDQIQVRLDADEEKLSACVNGVKSVAFPVLASTMTTVSMFTMFYMATGSMRKFISSLPTIVISALLASYAVSILVTPILCYLFMKKSKPLAKGKTTLLGSVGNAVDLLLQLAFKHKAATISIAILAIIASAGLLTTLRMEFMPTSNKAILDIRITASGMNDIRKAEEATLKVAEIVGEQPETLYYISAIGGNLPKYDFCAMPEGDGVNKGNVVIGVDLRAGKRFKSNGELADYLQSEINARIPGSFIEVAE